MSPDVKMGRRETPQGEQRVGFNAINFEIGYFTRNLGYKFFHLLSDKSGGYRLVEGWHFGPRSFEETWGWLKGPGGDYIVDFNAARLIESGSFDGWEDNVKIVIARTSSLKAAPLVPKIPKDSPQLKINVKTIGEEQPRNRNKERIVIGTQLTGEDEFLGILQDYLTPRQSEETEPSFLPRAI